VGQVYTPGCHESLGYDKGGRYSMGVERDVYLAAAVVLGAWNIVQKRKNHAEGTACKI